jgi:hypothetical protein
MLNRMGHGQMRVLTAAVMQDPEAGCRHYRISPGREDTPAPRMRVAGGEPWFARDSLITVEGRTYRKYGLPRVLAREEISPYAAYRGVPVFQEAGLAGTPEVLYVPARASCEVQPYVVHPGP